MSDFEADQEGSMLSAEQNEALTHVLPGTPMGDLLRRYWHPVAATAELATNPVKAVTLLGEPLVLFRDTRGRCGLLAEACAHRGALLSGGIREERGLRCAAHGWLYDRHGRCLDQPMEPAHPATMDDARTTAYPVEELGGLI